MHWRKNMHHWNAEDNNMAILQRWLEGKGVKPSDLVNSGDCTTKY